MSPQNFNDRFLPADLPKFKPDTCNCSKYSNLTLFNFRAREHAHTPPQTELGCTKPKLEHERSVLLWALQEDIEDFVLQT